VVLFGGSRSLDVWAERLEAGTASVQRWRRTQQPSGNNVVNFDPEAENWLLFLAVRRRGRMRPYSDETQLGAREEIAVAIWDERAAEVERWLRARGWEPVLAERVAEPAAGRAPSKRV